ncbi:DUF983 domain-containing protein [Paradesertivirga mongoliensis]|nr:DUF983 domain-containing protein [Pedobacter mongoliensis]
MKGLELNRKHIIPSEFSSALAGKCPRCRKGNMFTTSMYGFRLQKMNVNCPHCNTKFEREPGYFYVAMFISYAMNVAEMIAAAVSTWLITGNMENPALYMAVLLPVVILLAPFNYRYSRIILLYWLTPGLHFSVEMSKPSYEPVKV